MKPALHVSRPPDELRTPRVLLRPLRAIDVELDYDAVMSDSAALRHWSQSTWPADDFTLAENLVDLERHEREHLDGVAYTFTVLDPDESRCMGCVYLTPPVPEVAARCGGAAAPVQLGFWVRSSEIVGELDRHLFEALRGWVKESWAFDCVVYVISRLDERQVTLLGGALGAGTPVVRSDGRECMVFVERLARSSS